MPEDKAKDEGIKLKVAEAYQEDVYSGRVRVDYDVLEKLGLAPGDIIEIEGTRKTYAIADVLYPADQGLGIIRMDGLIRKNAGVGIGETVTVRRPPKPQVAKKVVLAPVKKEEQVVIDEYYLKNVLAGYVVTRGDYVVVRFDTFGFFIDFYPMKEMWFKVISTVPPKGPVIITQDTQIEIKPGGVGEEIPEVTYEDIGDMRDVIQKVREMVEIPLRHPEIFERLGIEPPKGVLLYGPPGTGKTLLAKAVANEAGAYFISINGPEIVSKYVGESEARLREIFEEAQKNAPAIIFIDEIDAIAPKRDEAVGEVERRLVAQLLTLMDGLKSRGKVIVIAATNRPNAIDPALRRPGRFDREIEIPVPNEEARYEILKVHTRRVPLGKKIVEEKDGKKIEKYVPLTKEEKERLLRWLASVTHGYVGADLAALVKEAAMNAIRRVIPDILARRDEELPKDILEKLMVTEEDFKEALKMITPSAMREFYVEVPKVKWKDIGGLDEVKQELREAVEWPIKYKDVFEKIGIKPPKGILLYGPPGTGKTLLAKAAASESGANFIAVKGPEILNKWVGESLPGDEIIYIIDDKGLFRKIKIEDFERGKALTIDDNKVATVKAAELIIHENRYNFVYRIRTKTGREIRVTGGHTLFTNENGGLKEVKVDELKVGMKIAIPAKIELPETVKEFDLLKALKDEKNVYLKETKELLNKAINILGIDKVSELVGIERKNLYSYLQRAKLPLNKAWKLIEKLKVDYSGYHIATHMGNELPAKVRFNEKLGELVGLFLADGSYFHNGIRISLSKEEYEEIKDYFAEFGSISVYVKTGNSVDIYFNNKLLKLLFKALGLVEGSNKKFIPELLFSTPREFKKGLLRGYFSGDGTFSGHVIEVSTVSKELANDIALMLLSFGIISSIKTKREWNGSISYRITITHKKRLKKFKEEIAFLFSKKNAKLTEYLEKANDYNGGYAKDIDRDIYWDEIVEISREEFNDKYIYDLTVEGTERFIAGFGGILVHNSERAIREIFRRARQAAPCIIFIDEIDAIAPARGSDVNRVTDRIVNQLLTEMDGITERGDVIVMGATNRPDILDPALLRPGRFDRIIYVPPPDKVARTEIFYIHSKQLPLDPEIDERWNEIKRNLESLKNEEKILERFDLKKEDIEEVLKMKKDEVKERYGKDEKITKIINLAAFYYPLAEKTEGYTGADISAVVREAAMLALREKFQELRGKREHDIKKALANIKIRYKHFEKALDKVGPSVDPDVIKAYEEFAKNFRKGMGKKIKYSNYLG